MRLGKRISSGHLNGNSGGGVPGLWYGAALGTMLIDPVAATRAAPRRRESLSGMTDCKHIGIDNSSGGGNQISGFPPAAFRFLFQHDNLIVVNLVDT
jgi:hypothetical protein